jgi:Arc/MetJ-type ribon-helix-helix transcriptional regulator
MSEQIAIRIPNELARELDEAVASGGYSSRAEAVRLAITALVDTERRHRVGAAIVEGYRRQPQSDEDVELATRAAIASIQEEPW